FDAEEFVGVREDALAWLQRYHWVVIRYAAQRLYAICRAPVFVRYGLLRLTEVSPYVRFVERIIDVTSLRLACPVVIIAKGHVKGRVADMLRFKRYADNMAL